MLRGIQFLAKSDAQLLSQTFQMPQILFILLLVFDLGLDTCCGVSNDIEVTGIVCMAGWWVVEVY